MPSDLSCLTVKQRALIMHPEATASLVLSLVEELAQVHEECGGWQCRALLAEQQLARARETNRRIHENNGSHRMQEPYGR